MRVHLIRKETIESFSQASPGSRASFEDWLEKIKNADWEKPMDIKQTFRSADLLGQRSSRVIFDIAGNTYRMICKYAFGDKQAHLFVCWIGTHAHYDELCSDGKQYSVCNY
jgi:mRNA interferase HigB